MCVGGGGFPARARSRSWKSAIWLSVRPSGWRFPGVAQPDSGRCATVPGGNRLLRSLSRAGAQRCRAETGCCAITYPPMCQSPREHSRAGKPAPCVRIRRSGYRRMGHLLRLPRRAAQRTQAVPGSILAGRNALLCTPALHAYKLGSKKRQIGVFHSGKFTDFRMNSYTRPGNQGSEKAPGGPDLSRLARYPRGYRALPLQNDQLTLTPVRRSESDCFPAPYTASRTGRAAAFLAMECELGRRRFSGARARVFGREGRKALV